LIAIDKGMGPAKTGPTYTGDNFMATRSTISIENTDGSVTKIYCHWDGYLDHNGRILHESYSTEDRVRELIALGDLSSLGREIGEKHPFHNPHVRGSREYLDHEKMVGDWCTAYGRDRDETNIGPENFVNIREMDLEEFNYHFRNSKWHLYMGKNKLIELTPDMVA
jgi:hypothetical protein